MTFLSWLAYTAEHFPDKPLPFTARELSRAIALDAAGEGESIQWTNTSVAHRLTGVSPRTLRHRADGWAELMARGKRPEIRVRKKSSKPNAPWEFCEADCRVYGTVRGHTPESFSQEETGPKPDTSEPQPICRQEEMRAITEDIDEYVKRAASR